MFEFYIITYITTRIHYAMFPQRCCCWSPPRLFLELCDTDDVDSNHLPISQLLQRSDQMREMCKQGQSSFNSLIWPQALRLMRPKYQHWVIISTSEALNFFTPRLWGHCCSHDDGRWGREKGRAQCQLLSPKYAEQLFFLPLMSLGGYNSCTTRVN